MIGEYFNVIISGGRDFSDYELMKSKCDAILSDKKNIKILSGTAKGADTWGEVYAKERGYVVHYYPAPWDSIGGKPEHEIGVTKGGEEYWKRAGIKRNETMAKGADALILFWNGKSKGSEDMLNRARKHGLKIRVVRY